MIQGGRWLAEEASSLISQEVGAQSRSSDLGIRQYEGWYVSKEISEKETVLCAVNLSKVVGKVVSQTERGREGMGGMVVSGQITKVQV